MASKGESPADSTQEALEKLLSGEEGVNLDALNKLTEALATERVDKILRYRTPSVVEDLRRSCAAYHAPQRPLKVGEIIRWKEGLKNKRHPAYDQPVVVWEIVDPPRVNSAESSGSQYFYEPLDLIIAYFLEDGDIGVYHVDSRRFEPHPDFRD
jgi:hypothetical protein